MFDQAPILNPPDQPARPVYPSPPRIHWFVLLLAEIAATTFIALTVKPPLQDLLQEVVLLAWPLYLCHWLRSLDADARSTLWCDLYAVIMLSDIGLSVWGRPSTTTAMMTVVLGLAGLVVLYVVIFSVRSDLERHYNEREPIGLHLSAVMTFFFSFLYFQYHLYRIAKLRAIPPASPVAGPTPLS
jgi:hypothetical protein